MDILAHNGVNHINNSEATAHIAGDGLKYLIVTGLIIIILSAIFLSAKRLGLITVSIRNKRR